jgi:hypothetical protein
VPANAIAAKIVRFWIGLIVAFALFAHIRSLLRDHHAGTTPNGRWALVPVSQTATASTVAGGNGVAVLERAADAYRLVGFVPLAAVFPSGLALNRDGTLLLVAVNSGVAFVDVQRAVTGAPGAVIGVELLGLPPSAGARAQSRWCFRPTRASSSLPTTGR